MSKDLPNLVICYRHFESGIYAIDLSSQKIRPNDVSLLYVDSPYAVSGNAHFLTNSFFHYNYTNFSDVFSFDINNLIRENLTRLNYLSPRGSRTFGHSQFPLSISSEFCNCRCYFSNPKSSIRHCFSRLYHYKVSVDPYRAILLRLLGKANYVLR